MTLGDLEGETVNPGKHLEWRDRDETWWVEYANCGRYVIDVNGLNLLSLGQLRRGDRGSSALASLVLLDVLERLKLVGVSGT